MTKFSSFYFLFLTSLLLFSNGYAQNPGFERLPNGVEYKFLVQNREKPKIKAGDIVRFHVVVKNYKDSVLFDTYSPQSQGLQQIAPFPEDADLNIVLTPFKLFAEGDSIIFRIKTDTLYNLSAQQGNAYRQEMQQSLKSLDTLQAMDAEQKQQQREYINEQIKSVQDGLKKLEKDLPKGKYNHYIIKVVVVSDPETEKKKAEVDAQKQLVLDTKLIQEYAQKKGLKTSTTASGLHYIIQKLGTGIKPQAGDTVKVNYTGMLLDGKIFDTSNEQKAKESQTYNPERKYEPIAFPLGVQAVIQGWDEGLALLPKGSKALLLIPSKLGYGSQDLGVIPANSVMIFEVEMVDIAKKKN
jgi:FKBP-type peptidyl-prolyl cis-trans isomerase FkpA